MTRWTVRAGRRLPGGLDVADEKQSSRGSGRSNVPGHALCSPSRFLHNILGIEVPGGYQLRAPLSVDADGAIHCAAEVPPGSRVRIMRTTVEASRRAAERATEAALAKLGGQTPGVALFFDCAATRFRVGDAYTAELEAVRGGLDRLPMVGCITYGQIGRAEGQFDTFQNCTALVCVLPA